MRNKALVLALWMAGCGSVGEAPLCGDGVVEGEEACDDGNTLSGDHCSSTCAIEPYCGDGIINGAEACDDANQTETDGCLITCETGPRCGDGTTDAGEACDDGNENPSDGCSATCTVEVSGRRTRASWTFRNVGSASELPCPAGFDTVAVYSQPVQLDGSPAGAPVIDLFDCTEGAGTTGPLFEGRYETYIASTNAGGSSTYATSLSEIVDLRTANGTFHADIFANGGFFTFAWNLLAANNTSTTCAQANASSISLLSTITNGTMAVEDLYNCTDGHGVTAALAAGTYTVSTSVLDTSMSALGVAPTLTNKVIQAPNKVTDLGTITVQLD